MGASSYRAKNEIAYPYHSKDGGPLLPVQGGALICGKCHEAITDHGFSDLRQARAAHEAAGERPLVIGKRPPPEALTVAGLAPAERKALVSIHDGRLNYLRSVDGLVALGLVRLNKVEIPRGSGFADVRIDREITEHGRRLAADCAAARNQAIATPPQMFDLGPPDPAAVRRIEDREAAERRRRAAARR